MKLNLKEDPKEWRKAAWLGALGLALFSGVLRWRRVLSVAVWESVLGLLAALAVTAALRPGWFRGYHRFSARVGFRLSQIVGNAFLAVFFFIIITPMGLVMRMAGKDPLRLRRQQGCKSLWSDVKTKSSLDRLF
jgi:hypothetical protein